MKPKCLCTGIPTEVSKWAVTMWQTASMRESPERLVTFVGVLA